MFVKDAKTGYTRDGQQKASGYFLLLVNPDLYVFDREERKKKEAEYKKDMRAIIRHCRMSQMGHFMMGKVRIGGDSYTVTGTYGSNGLPKTVPLKVYEKAITVPDELYEKWANGGGWNSSGSEGPDMRQWALDNFDELHKAGK